jgi:hypothetical protein
MKLKRELSKIIHKSPIPKKCSPHVSYSYEMSWAESIIQVVRAQGIYPGVGNRKACDLSPRHDCSL